MHYEDETEDLLAGCGVCLFLLLFCVAAWCVLVYAGYHAAAWVFG